MDALKLEEGLLLSLHALQLLESYHPQRLQKSELIRSTFKDAHPFIGILDWQTTY